MFWLTNNSEDTQFNIMEDEENQEMFTFEKLDTQKTYNFCSTLHDLYDKSIVIIAKQMVQL